MSSWHPDLQPVHLPGCPLRRSSRMENPDQRGTNRSTSVNRLTLVKTHEPAMNIVKPTVKQMDRPVKKRKLDPNYRTYWDVPVNVIENGASTSREVSSEPSTSYQAGPNRPLGFQAHLTRQLIYDVTLTQPYVNLGSQTGHAHPATNPGAMENEHLQSIQTGQILIQEFRNYLENISEDIRHDLLRLANNGFRTVNQTVLYNCTNLNGAPVPPVTGNYGNSNILSNNFLNDLSREILNSTSSSSSSEEEEEEEEDDDN